MWLIADKLLHRIILNEKRADTTVYKALGIIRICSTTGVSKFATGGTNTWEFLPLSLHTGSYIEMRSVFAS